MNNNNLTKMKIETLLKKVKYLPVDADLTTAEFTICVEDESIYVSSDDFTLTFMRNEIAGCAINKDVLAEYIENINGNPIFILHTLQNRGEEWSAKVVPTYETADELVIFSVED